jgi:hypothetical protein
MANMKSNAIPAHIKAHTTGRWAEMIFRALSYRIANRWKFVSFRGTNKGEWRGVVDWIAISKNRVRLGIAHHRAPPFVPAPNQRGIAFKGVRRCELGGIEVLPEAGLLVAERRDPAFGGDAGAGEDDDAADGA